MCIVTVVVFYLMRTVFFTFLQLTKRVYVHVHVQETILCREINTVFPVNMAPGAKINV